VSSSRRLARGTGAPAIPPGARVARRTPPPLPARATVPSTPSPIEDDDARVARLMAPIGQPTEAQRAALAAHHATELQALVKLAVPTVDLKMFHTRALTYGETRQVELRRRARTAALVLAGAVVATLSVIGLLSVIGAIGRRDAAPTAPAAAAQTPAAPMTMEPMMLASPPVEAEAPPAEAEVVEVAAPPVEIAAPAKPAATPAVGKPETIAAPAIAPVAAPAALPDAAAAIDPDEALPNHPERGALMASLRTVSGDLARCASDLALHGAVTLELDVAPRGAVEQVATASDALARCARQALAEVRFPRSLKGAHVRFPIVVP
jgi:hypothetical protein